MDWYILAPSGILHRAESHHVAGPSFSADQIADWSKYELCRRPGCFPEKAVAEEVVTGSSSKNGKHPAKPDEVKTEGAPADGG